MHKLTVKVAILGFPEGEEREWALKMLPDFVRTSPAVDLSRSTIGLEWTFESGKVAWEQARILAERFGEHLHLTQIERVFPDDEDVEGETEDEDDEGDEGWSGLADDDHDAAEGCR